VSQAVKFMQKNRKRRKILSKHKTLVYSIHISSYLVHNNEPVDSLGQKIKTTPAFERKFC